MADNINGQTPVDGGPAPAQDEILQGLALTLKDERGDAIQGRAQSGIEEQWKEDEEFYQGIDDANRGEAGGRWTQKPMGQPVPTEQTSTRSRVFPNMTRPYVDAAAARISDMLLPTDDRPWALKPTPIPDLVEVAEGRISPELQSQLAQISGGNQANVDQMSANLAAQAQAIIDEAKKKADDAQDQIEDWQIEGQYHAEVRKIIEDSARIGSGVLKGPVPVKRRVVALSEVDPTTGQPAQPQGLMQKLLGGVKSLFNSAKNAITTLIIKEDIKPASKRVNPWNFFPDRACGENIHNGSYTWERDFLTRKQLEELKDPQQGYLVDEITACLSEGPTHPVTEANKQDNKEEIEEKRFEIWYRHGSLDKTKMVAAGGNPGEGSGDSVPALVTMVNDRVIKAVLNPLDSGDFPYDLMPWQRKSGMPWGNGVARQGRTAQRIVTQATRNMMDNGGLSAGPQIVLGTQITPADGTMSLTPRKVWRFAEDADNDDVRKAMAFFEIPSRQKELMEIILFGQKLMEDATGLPMLLQGQQGSAPDTVGGMTMLNNNASSVLRRLARTFDDCVTEPHVRRYYTWLLQHGRDDLKGDFQIDARGSTALVERDLQNQQIPQLLKASGNPVFGIDPKKAMNQLLRAWHFDPKAWEFDDAQWQKIVENMAQKPADPRVQVETIKAQAADQRLTKEQQFEAQQKQADRQVQVLIQSVLEHIEAMKLTGAQEISFEELKTELASTAMKLRVQQTLSAQDAGVELHTHRIDKAVDLHKHHNPPPVMAPPVQTPGRAANGHAFQQTP